MDIAKLFRVVVVGGALLTANSCAGDPDEDTGESEDSVQTDSPDAAVEGLPDTGVQMVDAGGEELQDCGFCPNEICCEIDAEGNSTLRDGFECCWSTSC